MAADDATTAHLRAAVPDCQIMSQALATAGETGAAAMSTGMPPPGADALAHTLAQFGSTHPPASGGGEALTPHDAAAMGTTGGGGH